MKTYDKYKDSGIEWIGEIPDHWETKKLKYVISIKSGESIANLLVDDNLEVPIYGGNGILGYTNISNSDDIEIIVGRVGAYCGSVFLAKEKKWVSDNALRVSTNQNWEFLGYLLHILDLNKQASQNAQPLITGTLVKSQTVGIPEQNEQIQIAQFLDQKTAELDQAIALKEELIALLKEERAALINEAVTKGIDTNVPMKDSGIELIGKIPEHWELTKLRYVGRCQNGISAGAEYFGSGYPFVSYGNVYKNRVLPSNVSGLAKSTPTDRERYSVKEGDVFFTRTSETREEIGLASTCLETFKDATFAGFLIRFRPLEKIFYNGFSKYFFRCYIQGAFFTSKMNLVTRASLSQDLLKNHPILLPPMQEQIEISNYLDQKTSEIDQEIKLTEEEINLLNEYRQSLISEAVTGKIDVRDYVLESVG